LVNAVPSDPFAVFYAAATDFYKLWISVWVFLRSLSALAFADLRALSASEALSFSTLAITSPTLAVPGALISSLTFLISFSIFLNPSFFFMCTSVAFKSALSFPN